MEKLRIATPYNYHENMSHRKMFSFIYTDESGKKYTGTIEADDAKCAYRAACSETRQDIFTVIENSFKVIGG
jgi:hypothetical protein